MITYFEKEGYEINSGWIYRPIRKFLSNDERKKFALFILVGGINTLFGYFLYAILLFLHLHYALASLLATIGGVLFNFKTTGAIVFRNHNNSLIFRFVGVYSITYAINVGCLKIFASCHTNMYIAGLILVIPVALLSYCLLSRFVFGGEKNETDQRSNPVFQRGR